MTVDFRVVIPARYASTRLPGKPLRQIQGKAMIEWVYRAARNSSASDVVVATDDHRIQDAVENFGGQACMTDPAHPTGTDRIIEVAEKLKWAEETIVVNLQGDEPLMAASNLTQVAKNLSRSACDMATLHKLITEDQADDPNQVKLIHDQLGRALYFSRSIIPYNRSGTASRYYGHVGIYAYRVGFIKTFSALPPCEIERVESLEQLRALWNGYSIHTDLASAEPGPGVDTEEDLALVETMLRQA
jgi:3-deoxy-manno-octulosonate cytidylyltransferase (CMP-KDO synthetase)